MTKAHIPPFVEEDWDEESLGADPGSMKVVDKETAARLDEEAGTQLVSIRMQKGMVDAFKAIAAANKGIGYQTLMKQILQRFLDGEMRRVWNEHLAAKLAKAESGSKRKDSKQRKAA